jgi:hypothetical protein
MGLFLLIVTTVIVVLQGTLILSNREPNLWVFSLLQHKTSNISASLLYHDSPFAQCMSRLKSMETCTLWYHSIKDTETILDSAAWNPHLILLVISCIHLLLSFSNSQDHFYIKEHKINSSEEVVSTRIYHFSIRLTMFLLSLFCLVVGLIAANRNPGRQILDHPTIITSVVLLLATAWFTYIRYKNHNHNQTYHLWVMIFQLQIIGVPLAVLMISVMGARFYTDIVTHFMLLSVAVNSLWLQNHILRKKTQMFLLVFLRLLTIGIPLYCIFIAQTQWGEVNSWQQVSVFMAFFCMAPLFIYSFFPIRQSFFEDSDNVDEDTENSKRLQLKLVNLCTTAALGSTVINLALL